MPSASFRAAVLLALLSACAAPPAAPPLPPAPEAAPEGALRVARPLPVPESFRAAVANGTRTTEGVPGSGYWQQRVSYAIEAELDPETALLRGSETVVYHNRSPRPLPDIVLNIYQNVFSEGVPRNRYSPVTGGVELERVAAQGSALTATEWRAAGDAPGYAVRGTIGRITLPRPVAPGDSVVLEIDWHFRVPPEGAYRTAWHDTPGGRAFTVAQWYPQIATYDDLRGWDETPYLGDGEFYLEYGDFDVSLTVPAGWIVGGSGELVNARDVLSDGVLERLRAALETDGPTQIVTTADLDAGAATRAAAGGTLTWRFRATNVRDFAFATSNRYLWDVASATVAAGDGATRSLPVHALYRPGAPHWERAAGFGAHTMTFLSDAIAPYPYPQVTIAEGPIGGMEYPQIMFIGGSRQPQGLYGVIAHEAVHFWFPILVGSDEASYAWMDEGMANHFGALSAADLFGTDEPHAGSRSSYLAVAGTEAEVPLMRHTDLVSPYGARGVAAYTKPATLYASLRAILGSERFDAALRSYIAAWSYRHPAPWDFFNAMEREAGYEMDWFFYPWWFETATLDQAIELVEPIAGGARVTVRDLGEIAMPVYLVATTSAGETHRIEILVESWGGRRTVIADVRADAPVVRVEIDPGQVFPDVDRTNNVWPAAARE